MAPEGGLRVACGFFQGRRPVVLPSVRSAANGKQRPVARYANVNERHALVIQQGLASLHELQTVYDSEDFEDLLEMAVVNRFNVG